MLVLNDEESNSVLEIYEYLFDNRKTFNKVDEYGNCQTLELSESLQIQLRDYLNSKFPIAESRKTQRQLQWSEPQGEEFW